MSPTETNYKDGSRRTTQTNEKGQPISSEYNGSDGSKVFAKFQNGKPLSANFKFRDGKEINIEKYYDESEESGYGRITAKDFTYVGEIKSLAPWGKGEMNYQQTRMVGEFKNGRMEGSNCTVSRPEFTFTGSVSNDDVHSYQTGSVTFANGDTYEGNLRDYVLHGWGTYVHDEHCSGWGNCNSFTIRDNFQNGKSNMRPVVMPAAAAIPDNNWFKVPIPIYGRTVTILGTSPGIPWEQPNWTPEKGWSPIVPILNPINTPLN